MILHIFGQPWEHAEAWISGDMEALKSLRDALTRAIESGKADSSEAFTRDGEGYYVMVVPVSDETADKLVLPYTDVPYGYLEQGKGVYPNREVSLEEYRRLTRPKEPDEQE